MLKDPNMRSNGDGQRERELGSASRLSGGSLAPLADREVPIAAPSPFEAMHRWLDGELAVEALERDAEAEHNVELWRRLGRETERRSRERAPSDLTARIMAALPGAATAEQPHRVVEAPVAAVAAVAPVVAAPALAAPAVAAGTAAADAAATADVQASTWWHRPVEMNPATALAAAAGLVALGLAVGAALKG